MISLQDQECGDLILTTAKSSIYSTTPVTITGTPKSGGTAITYSFTLGSWFINNGSTGLNWPDAAAYCTTQSGYSQPTRQQLNGNGSHAQGTLGGLWSEWGDVTQYNGAGFYGGMYWSSEFGSFNYYSYVDLLHGYSSREIGSHKLYVVCRQGL